MAQTILVTGGAGFIGSHLVDALVERGDRVVVIDNLSSGKREQVSTTAEFHEFDLATDDIAGLIQSLKPDLIFHLSAQVNVRKSISDPLHDLIQNVVASIRLMDASARESQPPGIIFISTGGAMSSERTVLPTPEEMADASTSPYALAKRTVEKYGVLYRKHYRLPCLTARLANVYGPRQNPQSEAGVVAIFLSRMIANEHVVITGDGTQTRDFIYVDDVVDGLLELSKHVHDAKCSIYNLGSSIETSVNDLFAICAATISSPMTPRFGAADMGAPLRSALDTTRIQTEFGWNPTTTIQNGISKTANWFKSHVS